ncbi:fatty acid desaturase family protein [Sphingomonas sp. CJ20]
MLEDRAMLAAAAQIARRFSRPSAPLYWTDLIVTAAIAYASFCIAVFAVSPIAIAGGCVVAVLAFYRGLSFIHELTHFRRGSLPGFYPAWNILFGIPLLTPSFLYEGVHSIHHARARYGTPADPEYLPLASMPRAVLLPFLAGAALAPVGLWVRFAVLAPLSLLSPRLRDAVVARYSALTINPAFRRQPAKGALRRRWIAQETAASIWAIAIVALGTAGVMSLRGIGTAFLIGAGVALLNQVRTLVAHVWGNADGRPMSLTAQYLDSVNIPPPALLPALWAPIGLRYHALHHLLPSVPYHQLGAAHRAMIDSLGKHGTIAAADHSGFLSVLRRIGA